MAAPNPFGTKRTNGRETVNYRNSKGRNRTAIVTAKRGARAALDLRIPQGGGGSRSFTNIANRRGFVVTDGVTNTDTSLSSATGGFLGMAGRAVSGTGIPNGTTISTVTDDNNVVLSAATTATATGVTVTVASAGVKGTQHWWK